MAHCIICGENIKRADWVKVYGSSTAGILNGDYHYDCYLRADNAEPVEKSSDTSLFEFRII